LSNSNPNPDHPLTGKKQSPEHIAKRKVAIMVNRETWTEEKKQEWRAKIKANNKAGTPEVRKANADAHKGRTAWNKGLKTQTLESKREYHREYQRERRKSPGHKVHSRMSALIRAAVRNKNGRSWQALVDYTLDNLMKHLESNFLEGMSWDNIEEWHIDHIIPRSIFKFETEYDIAFKQCWALSNLHPLWVTDNLKKGSKLPQWLKLEHLRS
jgi:hypothetical protein